MRNAPATIRLVLTRSSSREKIAIPAATTDTTNETTAINRAHSRSPFISLAHPDAKVREARVNNALSKFLDWRVPHARSHIAPFLKATRSPLIHPCLPRAAEREYCSPAASADLRASVVRTGQPRTGSVTWRRERPHCNSPEYNNLESLGPRRKRVNPSLHGRNSAAPPGDREVPAYPTNSNQGIFLRGRGLPPKAGMRSGR